MFFADEPLCGIQAVVCEDIVIRLGDKDVGRISGAV